MTPKQQRFVDEYAIDYNATQAAIRAGYSEKTAQQIASENLSKPVVKAAIDAKLAELSQKTGLTQEWVREVIHETGERCRQAQPVLTPEGKPMMIETPNGELAAAFRFEPGYALKAAELAGRHLKMFTDKVEIGGNVSFTLNFAGQDAKVIEGQAVEVGEIESDGD